MNRQEEANSREFPRSCGTLRVFYEARPITKLTSVLFYQDRHRADIRCRSKPTCLPPPLQRKKGGQCAEDPVSTAARELLEPARGRVGKDLHGACADFIAMLRKRSHLKHDRHLRENGRQPENFRSKPRKKYSRFP